MSAASLYEISQGRFILGIGTSGQRVVEVRAGRDPSQIDVALLTAAIPLGRKYGMNIAKDILSFYIGGMGDFYKELLSGMGFAEDCERIATLYQDRATRAEARSAVPDAMVEAMTVSGDPLEVRNKLRELPRLGVTQPLLGLPASASWPAIAGYLRAVAPGRAPSPLQLMATGALRTATAVAKARA
jgi:alkanesulfonate monooxygenase SsuD/methylene tetrahydromethanopterin reductase-like flavin-dependent oxidoreductase (luciferase family)